VLAALLGTRGLPAALRAHDQARAHAEGAARRLMAAREALEEEPVARDSLRARGARLLAWAPRLVAGGTPGEAAAELSGLVSGLAAGHRVRLLRLQPVSEGSAGPFAAAGLRLEAQADVAGIAGWLAALEEGPTLLVVRELAISALEPAAPGTQAEVLRVELRLAGWAPWAGRAAPGAEGRE
jgi:hypothetical protein